MVTIWIQLAVICFAFTFTHGNTPITCKRNFEKVGCFIDKTGKKGKIRALKTLLITDRDKKSDKNDGHVLDWHNWEESMHSLACRCANATRSRGWKIFSIQFYGECWSDEQGEVTYNKYGPAKENKCIQELKNPPPPCDKSKDMECVGTASTNYVYILKNVEPSDIDGGYGDWSVWTKCSKSCGGGLTARERTCTNPPSKGKGKDCSHLGPGIEKKACNEASCQNSAGDVDGSWSKWGNWGKCTKTCGGGTQVRERTCSDPSPKVNGLMCPGSGEESRACSEGPCPKPCIKALDIGIILDGSGSVGSENFLKAKEFIAELITHFQISPGGTHVGMITYSTDAKLEFNMANSTYHHMLALKTRAKEIKYPSGWTRTDKALEMASSQLFTAAGGDRADKTNILIVFTDGKTNYGSQPYPEVLRPLQVKEVRTVAVGIGVGIRDAELLQIAMGDQNYVTHVSNFDALKGKLDAILDESCQGNPPSPPDPDCSHGEALGLESKSIPDVSLSSSSQWDQNHGPELARLNMRPSGGKIGSWSAKDNDKGQWLQVDLGKVVKVTRIDTQGRNGHNQWVKSFWVSHSLDGGYFTEYASQGVKKVFVANKDQNSIVTNSLEDPLFTRYIRIHPETWHSHISMRLELFGCKTGFVPPVPEPCMKSLGLEHGLQDAAFSASSQLSSVYKASNARLHMQRGSGRAGAWAAAKNDRHQWLQIDLGQATKVRRVATQGKQEGDQWVTSYSLSHSIDGLLFESYKQNGHVTKFHANEDRWGVVIRDLNPPIIARFLRFEPQSYHQIVCMRAELYGCTSGFPIPPKPSCTDALGAASGKIADQSFSASSMLSNNYSPAHGRLNKASTWIAKVNDNQQWLQIDLGQWKSVSRIATQGRHNSDQWVTSYTVSYSTYGGHFDYYKQNDQLKVFKGNYDRNNIHVNALNPPIKTTRFIRIHPRTWYRHVSMRVEVYGCQGEAPPPPPCKHAMDVGIIMDRSGSVGSANFQKARDFVTTLVHKLQISSHGTRVGIIAYQSSATLIVNFANHAAQEPNAMAAKIKGIHYSGGGTRTDIALQKANELFTNAGGDRQDKPNVLVVMTDGKTNSGSKPYTEVLDPLLKKKVRVVAVGVGHSINMKELDEISGGQPKNVIKVDDFNGLFGNLNSVLRASCEVSVVPSDPECKNYQVLEDAERSVDNVKQQYECDKNKLTHQEWYRFQGAAGNQMPTRCATVPKLHCGTHAPGWMEGQHPSVADGVVQRKVCFHWSNSCCLWSIYIAVRNCGRFYVYRLAKPPVCHLRYCGMKGPDIELSTVPPPTAAPQAPECSSYTLLGEANRKISYENRNVVLCDSNMAQSWYRFSAAAGEVMPESCVPEWRCGTHAPGWLNGKHPTEAEGVVTRQVCYHWSKKCCNWINDIKVRNCGGFYVYELRKPPVCSLRYCGGGGAGPIVPPTTAAPQAPECSSYTMLNDANRKKSYENRKVVLCDGNMAQKWYRFSAAAGEVMPESCVPEWRCGTHAPGWLNGKHPTVADGAVTRDVCYNWVGKCCNWKNDIRVRNCGGFYVYELKKTPGCSFRYCGGGGAGPIVPPTTAAPQAPECSSYTMLNDANRKKSYENRKVVLCDGNMAQKWYRFSAAAGEVMPESCVPEWRCGTHAPGWLNGKHPTVADGAVTRDVCYNWVGKCCNWKNNIRVRNCGGFYVYELKKTPGCSFRYCGGAGP